jgi:flagellar biogenesis protein FliO
MTAVITAFIGTILGLALIGAIAIIVVAFWLIKKIL